MAAWRLQQGTHHQREQALRSAPQNVTLFLVNYTEGKTMEALSCIPYPMQASHTPGVGPQTHHQGAPAKLDRSQLLPQP